MAIRKFRKIMKPITFIVAAAMIGSGVWLTLSNLQQHRSVEETQYAFKINGEKVYKIKIAREENAISEEISKIGNKQGDKETIALLAFQKSINDALTLELAKEMKIKVPSSEVKAEYQKVEDAIGNKEQFKRMLSIQGYSKKTFKAMLEENLLVQKLSEKFQEEGEKIGKDGFFLYQEALAKKKESMNLEKVAPEFEKYQEKVVEEKDGFKITNVDIASKVLETMLLTGMPLEDARNFVKEQFYRGIEFAVKAKEEGVEVSETLPLLVQLQEYQSFLFEQYKKEVKIEDAELANFFKANQENYNLHASMDADIAILKPRASQEDLETIEKEAKKTLSTLTPDNFSKEGKELQNKNPGTVIYEELGWFEKGAMVEEFEKAAFSAKQPGIYPKVISTKFGKHLLYIQEINQNKVKAAHILYREIPSQKSLEYAVEEAERLKDKLESKGLSFETLKNFNKDILFSHHFEKIDKSGMIPGFVQDLNFVNYMYATEINKVGVFAPKEVLANGWIYIFRKTEEVPDKKVTLEEVREKVEDDYRSFKAKSRMSKLLGE